MRSWKLLAGIPCDTARWCSHQHAYNSAVLCVRQEMWQFHEAHTCTLCSCCAHLGMSAYLQSAHVVILLLLPLLLR
jgi:hypothetical protein